MDALVKEGTCGGSVARLGMRVNGTARAQRPHCRRRPRGFTRGRRHASNRLGCLPPICASSSSCRVPWTRTAARNDSGEDADRDARWRSDHGDDGPGREGRAPGAGHQAALMASSIRRARAANLRRRVTASWRSSGGTKISMPRQPMRSRRDQAKASDRARRGAEAWTRSTPRTARSSLRSSHAMRRGARTPRRRARATRRRPAAAQRRRPRARRASAMLGPMNHQPRGDRPIADRKRAPWSTRCSRS